MKVNFEIEENYAILYNGMHIDLHNNFEFSELIEKNDTIRMVFRKSTGDWIPTNEFEQIHFIHHQVNFKKFVEDDTFEFPEDSNTLSTITFFPKTNCDIHNAYIQQATPSTNDDIIYSFENGKLFRIHSKQVEVMTINKEL